MPETALLQAAAEEWWRATSLQETRSSPRETASRIRTLVCKTAEEAAQEKVEAPEVDGTAEMAASEEAVARHVAERFHLLHHRVQEGDGYGREAQKALPVEALISRADAAVESRHIAGRQVAPGTPCAAAEGRAGGAKDAADAVSTEVGDVPAGRCGASSLRVGGSSSGRAAGGASSLRVGGSSSGRAAGGASSLRVGGSSSGRAEGGLAHAAMAGCVDAWRGVLSGGGLREIQCYSMLEAISSHCSGICAAVQSAQGESHAIQP